MKKVNVFLGIATLIIGVSMYVDVIKAVNEHQDTYQMILDQRIEAQEERTSTIDVLCEKIEINSDGTTSYYCVMPDGSIHVYDAEDASEYCATLSDESDYEDCVITDLP